MVRRRSTRRAHTARWTAASVLLLGAALGGCSEKSVNTSTFEEDDPIVDNRDGAASRDGASGTGWSGWIEHDAQGAPWSGEIEGGPSSSGCATLSGTVYTPGKTDPLYNAVVYIAAGPIPPIASGASCEKCGVLSGTKAVAATLSGADGRFSLAGVPLGQSVPLVIQMGKWRRVVPINVTACGELQLPSDLTRLPRDRTEGNLPLTAIATGGADSLECILRKFGVADSEFTTPSGGGRIHIYHATGANAAPGDTPDGSQLWSDPQHLDGYDMVLLPCEGDPTIVGKTAGFQNLVDYTSRGGRVFVTHYDYSWIKPPGAAFPATATWTDETKYFGDGYDYPVVANVDVSFPKGRDFAKWLLNVGASSRLGEIELHHVAHNADDVIPDVAQSWLHSDAAPRQFAPDGRTATSRMLHQYTFNTPVGAAPENQCGRVVYSAFHVNDADSGALTFPAECTDAPLTGQEKALMFMLFDLASCVQTDREPPVAPIVN